MATHPSSHVYNKFPSARHYQHERRVVLVRNLNVRADLDTPDV
jgi:hypothetical protein